MRPFVERNIVLLTPVAGVAVAAIAIAFEEESGHSYAGVLFSGQNELPSLVAHAGTWSVGALVAVVVCKGLAYGISLSSFRGGPIFPSLFIGAAGGIAMSHLPGLPMIAGMSMGIGAMSTVMLKLPLTSVLVASLLVASAGAATIPLIIIASTAAYVGSVYFSPIPPNADKATELNEDVAPAPADGEARAAA